MSSSVFLRRGWWLGLLAAGVGLALAAAWWWQAQRAQQAQQDRQASVQRGMALFHGARPLQGRVVGHQVDLPAAAVACINCHGDAASERPRAAAADAAASGLAPRFAPPLTAQHLAQALKRRGGPASRYDATSLCLLLREGLDPATVMIPQTMPRYQVSEAQCADLWQYFLSR
ncbi:MAG: hypothetical protein C4K60_10980 [Ideonella sp. MAG2]|nr:MAG: hypothetical protein C4K60_10980 [Ideonella sp. MAG2]